MIEEFVNMENNVIEFILKLMVYLKIEKFESK